ncbi:hypothetical protein AHAS_Ahas11G0345700 [Arachis hypogaea]
MLKRSIQVVDVPLPLFLYKRGGGMKFGKTKMVQHKVPSEAKCNIGVFCDALVMMLCNATSDSIVVLACDFMQQSKQVKCPLINTLLFSAL